ncbi:hypothetical protein G7Z99_17510 [Pseudomonas entomophila]|nr:hypothetical protein [Pseudomonas entomophila]MBA1190826.1 hypothetical protein [Pseudomonas entomophila]
MTCRVRQMEPATQGDLFDYLLTVLRESGLAGRGPGEGPRKIEEMSQT